MKPSTPPRPGLIPLLLSTLSTILLSGCVKEKISGRADLVPLFEFGVELPTRLLSAGTFHGTQVFVELDLENDIEPRGVLTDAKLEQRMAPVVPSIAEGLESYSIGVHRIDLRHSTWILPHADPATTRSSPFRYPVRAAARLYVFKEVQGDFEFEYRGQKIVVESKRPWLPSVHYYYETEWLDHGTENRRGVRAGRQRTIREVVQIGNTSIENLADVVPWNVGRHRFTPGEGRTLRISGAVPALAPPSR